MRLQRLAAFLLHRVQLHIPLHQGRPAHVPLGLSQQIMKHRVQKPILSWMQKHM